MENLMEIGNNEPMTSGEVLNGIYQELKCLNLAIENLKNGTTDLKILEPDLFLQNHCTQEELNEIRDFIAEKIKGVIARKEQNLAKINELITVTY
jgi:hypothetical protein